MLVVLAILNYCKRRCNYEEAARLLVLPVNTFMFVVFTVVVPSSYDMVEALGRGASFSGLMIGIHMLGCALGSLSMSVYLRLWPDTWRKPHSIMIVSFGMHCVGLSLYTYVGHHVDTGGSSKGLEYLLLGARTIQPAPSQDVGK